jgi:DNA-binding FadR family transcriptional regulator
MPKHKAPEIAAALKARIDSGEWAAAGAIPNERALALEFGVARNTIRNAFKALEAEGLISRHVGRGTMVKQKASDELARIVANMSGASPLDLLNLRIIIEPQVTATAATHASAHDIAEVAEADRHAIAARDLEGFESWDDEFHRRIYAGTRNEFLINLFGVLSIIRHREPMMDIRRRAFTEERRLAYCAQHREIIGALASRDAPAAARAMHAHLAARRRNYFGE